MLETHVKRLMDVIVDGKEVELQNNIAFYYGYGYRPFIRRVYQ